MKKFLLFIIMFVQSLIGFAQTYNVKETRLVVGVDSFICLENSKYAPMVAEKVAEMLTNTHRFIVVDRTSLSRVMQEMELQKNATFIDSKVDVDQYASLKAQRLITGQINKIPIYRIKNGDGSTQGYKGSISFNMKIIDTATKESTEAISFESKASQECLSPESAVNMAMKSLESEIYEYFRLNFPVTGKIVKILTQKKEVAETLLIDIGKKQGIKVGDHIGIAYVEIIEDQPFENSLGEMVVDKLNSETFSECTLLTKKNGKELQSRMDAKTPIACSLIVKKKK